MDDSSSIALKRCSRCKQSHPATKEFFASNKAMKDGLANWCKACVHAKQKETFIPKRIPDPAPDGFRTCKVCGEIKPATTDFFYVDKTVPCGLQSCCIVCRRKQHQQNYQEHLEERRQQHIEYGRINKDAQIEYHKKWYIKNRERVLVFQQVYRLLINPDHKRLYWHEYAQRPEVRERRRIKRRQRNLLRKATGSYTARDIQQQHMRQRGKCYYCGEKLTQYHIDHIVPLSRGGSNNPDNLVLACPPCNLSKGDKLLHEWIRGGRLL